MITVTVIKSDLSCESCEETARIVAEVARNFPQETINLEILTNGTPETRRFGIITTPVVVINDKIYSMGKPVIQEKIEHWINKELGR